MGVLELLVLAGVPALADQVLNEGGATHPDGAMDAGHRNVVTEAAEGLPPREGVQVVRVHQRAVNVEQDAAYAVVVLLCHFSTYIVVG